MEDVCSFTERISKPLITLIIYGIVSVVFSIVLNVVSHHTTDPSHTYSLLSLATGVVFIEIAFAPGRSYIFAPILLTMVIWWGLRVANNDYWVLVNKEIYPPPMVDANIRFMCIVIQLTVSLLSMLKFVRRHWILAFLSVIVVGTHILPGQEPAQEWITGLQCICFIVLYFLAMVVIALMEVNDGLIPSGALKILQSHWCLFIENPIALVIAVVVQGAASFLYMAINSNSFEHARWEKDQGSNPHAPYINHRKKEESMEEEI